LFHRWFFQCGKDCCKKSGKEVSVLEIKFLKHLGHTRTQWLIKNKYILGRIGEGEGELLYFTFTGCIHVQRGKPPLFLEG
jgi:hypothetical protein